MLFSKKTSEISWSYRSSDSTVAGDCEYIDQPRLARFFGRSARRRGRLLQRLETCGCPAWGVAAVGVQNAEGLGSRIVLRTRSIDSAKTFKSFINGGYRQLSQAQKCRFTVSLGRFLRRLHDAGIATDHRLYDDLLVNFEESEFFFGLFGRYPFTVKKAPLSARQQLVSLSGLYAMVHGLTGKAQRWRFLTAYLCDSDVGERRRWMRRFAARGLKQCRRIWWRLARRSLKSNSDYVSEKRQGFSVLRLRSAEAQTALHELLPDPDRAFEGAVIYKPGSRTHAGQVVLAGRRYFLKRYNRRSLGYGLVRLGRLSRARRTWLVSRGGVLRNLPIPRPILCLEEKVFGMVRRSYILMDFFEKRQRLWHIESMSDAKIASCLSRFGEVIGNMHVSGFSHGDLKWDNILIYPRKPFHISLVDFDGSRISRRVRTGRINKDLRRFCRDFKCSQLSGKHLESFMRGWRRGAYYW
jgi:tRNA A-37 threonylcarbamoyl transferase component Bud32